MAEEAPDKRRKYPRVKVGKGMFVGWKSPRQRTVSRAREMGLGGVYLYTKTPATIGSVIELIFDVPGGEIRARAAVRHVQTGVGMGLQFVHMRPEHRERLNRYLTAQKDMPAEAAAPSPGAGANDTVKKSSRPAKQGAGTSSPTASPTTVGSAETARQSHGAQGAQETQGAKSAESVGQQASFEEEVKELLELAHRGTYYQILAVTPDSSVGQVKKKFYSLAQKFHPDHHMAKVELVGSLQQVMEVVTLAYKTLSDETARAAYDKALAASEAYQLHRGRTESQETVEDCMTKARESLRAGNFVGSVVWLRKIVELTPHDAKYHALLARSLAKLTHYRNEAIEHFDTAIELDPWNVRIYFQYAQTCEEIQLFSRARGLYTKILEIDPTHAMSLQRLAQMDEREKETETVSVLDRMFGKRG